MPRAGAPRAGRQGMPCQPTSSPTSSSSRRRLRGRRPSYPTDAIAPLPGPARLAACATSSSPQWAPRSKAPTRFCLASPPPSFRRRLGRLRADPLRAGGFTPRRSWSPSPSLARAWKLRGGRAGAPAGRGRLHHQRAGETRWPLADVRVDQRRRPENRRRLLQDLHHGPGPACTFLAAVAGRPLGAGAGRLARVGRRGEAFLADGTARARRPQRSLEPCDALAFSDAVEHAAPAPTR